MQPLTPGGIARFGVAVHVGVGPTVAVDAALRDGATIVGGGVAGVGVRGAALGVRGVAVATGVVVTATAIVEVGTVVLASTAGVSDAVGSGAIDAVVAEPVSCDGCGCASAGREPHDVSVAMAQARTNHERSVRSRIER